MVKVGKYTSPMDGMASFIGLDGLSEKKNILTQEDTESTAKEMYSQKIVYTCLKNPNSTMETNTNCRFISSNLFKFHLDW